MRRLDSQWVRAILRARAEPFLELVTLIRPSTGDLTNLARR